MAENFNKQNILTFAHRGASAEYPENTIPAFRRAAELNADYIETDVHFTKDNNFVVIHDDTIDRVTDGKGSVGNYTMAELKEFDAGYNFSADSGETFPYRGKGIKLISLDELLLSFPDRKFNIDLKDNNIEQTDYFLDSLKKYNAIERVIIASKHHCNLKSIREKNPDIQTSLSVREIIFILFLYFCGVLFLKRTFKAITVQIPLKWKCFNIATEKFISELHKKNLKIHVWTVNKADDMKRLIEFKADGIMSDNPELLIKLTKN